MHWASANVSVSFVSVAESGLKKISRNLVLPDSANHSANTAVLSFSSSWSKVNTAVPPLMGELGRPVSSEADLNMFVSKESSVTSLSSTLQVTTEDMG